jgi:glycosyltransferase involved in cell wall biosynthesis
LRHRQAIRLLKVLTTYAKGGTEGQVLNLASRLDRQTFALHSACLRKGGEILADFERLGIPVTEFRIRNLYEPQTWVQQMRFAEQLRANRIQIVHSYNFYANIFAIPAARLARTPVVIASIRDQGVYLTRAQQLVQKWVCRMADRVLVNADSIRQWLVEQGYEPHKITVIKNGIDASLYGNRKPDGRLRREFGIPASAPIIMMIARLNPQKGLEEFIQAAARIHRSHPAARFLILGANLRYVDGTYVDDTRYRSELQRLAAELGVADRVLFTGHRTDIPEVLAEAAISVLPSHSEGLSNSLLESMAAGVPTVATDAGGNPELVKDGVNGILVPVKSPQRLAHACRRILDDPQFARRLGQSARCLAESDFSLERMTADTRALYLAELQCAKRDPSRERAAAHGRALRSGKGPGA